MNFSRLASRLQRSARKVLLLFPLRILSKYKSSTNINTNTNQVQIWIQIHYIGKARVASSNPPLDWLDPVVSLLLIAGTLLIALDIRLDRGALLHWIEVHCRNLSRSWVGAVYTHHLSPITCAFHIHPPQDPFQIQIQVEIQIQIHWAWVALRSAVSHQLLLIRQCHRLTVKFTKPNLTVRRWHCLLLILTLTWTKPHLGQTSVSNFFQETLYAPSF